MRSYISCLRKRKHHILQETGDLCNSKTNILHILFKAHDGIMKRNRFHRSMNGRIQKLWRPLMSCNAMTIRRFIGRMNGLLFALRLNKLLNRRIGGTNSNTCSPSDIIMCHQYWSILVDISWVNEWVPLEQKPCLDKFQAIEMGAF